MNKAEETREMKILTLFAILIIIGGFLFVKTAITGFVVVDISNHTEGLDLDYTTNTSYVWSPSSEGILTSLRLSGYIEGDSVSVYLLDNLVYNYSYNVISPTALAIGNGSGEISLNFDYGFGSGYDNNNDGTAFISDVIDFSINPSFDFDYNESYLCTKYIVNNLDLNVSYPVCYGSVECCSFLNLESLGNWSDSLLLNYGKYSSGYNNTVDATVVYYDVNLSAPYSNIYNSETLRLNANFIDRVYFEDICVDSCSDLSLENEDYELDINVDGLLHISNISYNIGEEEVIEIKEEDKSSNLKNKINNLFLIIKNKTINYWNVLLGINIIHKIGALSIMGILLIGLLLNMILNKKDDIPKDIKTHKSLNIISKTLLFVVLLLILGLGVYFSINQGFFNANPVGSTAVDSLKEVFSPIKNISFEPIILGLLIIVFVSWSKLKEIKKCYKN